MDNIIQSDYNDFEELRKSASWFFNESDEIEFLQSDFEISQTFQKSFPQLTKLIKSARVQSLKINKQSYRLFSWTVEGKSCGWLSIFENNFKGEITLIDEHKLVLNEMGGIVITYNESNYNFLGGQKFIFTESKCSKGIDGWDNYYNEICDENEISEINKINYKEFIVFAQEANGDVTFYNPDSKAVMQFNHDGKIIGRNGEYINVVMNNQPEDTFYTIKGVKYFTDYVERLADEWLNFINSAYNIVYNLLERKQFDEAIKITEMMTDNFERGEIENLIGIKYFYLADFKKALLFYLKALDNKYFVTEILDYNIWEVCEELSAEENDKVKWSHYYLTLFPKGQFAESAKMNV